MADERLRTKRELKRLFTNLKRKGISDDMISILIDTLWRDRANLRTSGFFHAGGFDAQFSFNIQTRIFSIVPFDPLVEGFEPRYSIFSWSNLAVHHRIFTPHEIEIPNEEGLFCVYFDKEPDPGTSQILTYKKNPTIQELEDIYVSRVLISCFYWDAANNELLHFGNDKHGSEWNPQLHWFIHTTQGAKRKSGLQFTGYILNGDGSSNNHAKFNITGGVMLHDDFEMTIPTSSNTIPVIYSFGTYPRFLANNGYAFAGSGRVYFNSGQISLVQADSNNLVLYHIFATNEILTASRKIISVMGTAQYTTLADAYQGISGELDGIVTYMPQQGRCYLGSVIIQTSDDYTNDKKARIVALTGNETHPPVTIAPGSKQYLFVNEKQELEIDIDALPIVPSTDEKLKYDAADPTAGYLADKIIPGSNISINEGTGIDENKMVLSSTSKIEINGSVVAPNVSTIKFRQGTKITITYNANGEIELNVQSPDAPITQYSIQGNGALGSEIQLVQDNPAPGANKYYGTGVTGEKGFHGLPNTGANSWLELSDTIPTDFLGKAKHVPMVTDAETDLDLVDTEELQTILAEFKLLADVPNTYSGSPDYYVKVKADGTGLYFSEI